METFVMERGPDKVTITILDDGRVKTETGKISVANHTDAEKVLDVIQAELGGQTKVKSKAAHAHSHGTHEHHQHH